jgi:lysylphosphatidylglycerol synthetase-like protein (DUF2156 family)
MVLTNVGVICLFVGGPIRQRHDELLLYRVMRTDPPAFSYVHAFISDPWRVALVVMLLVGIFAELRRTILSPILNLGLYFVWFIVFSWDAVEFSIGATPSEVAPLLVLVLTVIPLAVVIGVDLFFYIPALRQLRPQRTDAASQV